MGLYSIITRADGTVLTGFGSTSDIFNVDHENHVIHTAAAFLNSWEEDVAQMRLTTRPTDATGASPSLTNVLKDEIERLRYQIARIKQVIAGAATPPFWYTPTASFTDGVQLAPTAGRVSLSTLQSIPDNVFTTVTFNQTDYLLGGVTRSPALLHVPVDGVYICGATLAFTDPLNMFQLLLRHSHLTTSRDIAANAVYNTVNFPATITVETVKRLQAGDAIRLLVLQQSGSAKIPLIDADERPSMWMALVGRG